MNIAMDTIDLRLLENWQRDFPLTERPFAEVGAHLDCDEDEVLQRLRRLSAAGAVSRVGATVRPNTAGASTLAAVAAPTERIEEVARVISAEAGVNHSYLREDAWNIWFVATGPVRESVDALLRRIGSATGLRVLDLPLVRPYHLDLGFGFDGTRRGCSLTGDADLAVLRPQDNILLDALTGGLGLVPRPFASLAAELGWSIPEVLGRIRDLTDAGIVSRFGVIVRHRALGWRSNAMVVWQVPEEDVGGAGVALAAATGVTLCYQRRTDPENWPFNLYCMIHARSRAEALTTLERATDDAGLVGLPRRILFSTRCFKQKGAVLANDREVAA